MTASSEILQLAQSVEETLVGVPLLLPLLILVAGIVGVLAWDWFLKPQNSSRVSWLASFGLLGSMITLVPIWQLSLAGPTPTGWGMLVIDSFSVFLWLFFLVSTFVVVTISRSSWELQGRRVGEFYSLLLIATLASCVLVASHNLVVLYLAFETLSLCSYALAGYARERRESVEASLKYVLFGAVASGIMLYGVSVLYGMVGSLDLGDVAPLASQNPASFLLVLVLIFAGFAFKMSLVPFHFWAPDVYQGAPTPITAYLSVVSKAAGFGVALRFLAPILGVVLGCGASASVSFPKNHVFALLSLLWILATLTMTLGNFVALRQQDFKRLLAYSSIAHAGYMVTALVAASALGYAAILFYFAVYAIANLGLFYAAQVVSASKGNFEIASFRGVIHESPLFAVCVGTLLWSLIGLPPSGGFLGKFFLFYAVVEKAVDSTLAPFYYALVLIALANSVVSLYYYVAVIREMAFYKPPENVRPLHVSPGARIGLAFAAALILGLQIYWQPLTDLSQAAVGEAETLTSTVAPNYHSAMTVSAVTGAPQ